MIVVVDATPLIALAIIDQLVLLQRLFADVLVPSAVYKEVLAGTDKPGATVIANASWLQVRSPAANPTIEPLLLGLDEGEFQVLLLAREVQADWVLLDEKLGRRVAQALHLPVKGTVGVLLAAVHAGLLPKAQALLFAQQLTTNGIRISPSVMRWLRTQIDHIA